MEPQTTTNKMENPSDLEQSTPQWSESISGKKRNNPDSPDSYSPSDKQLEKQPRTFSPLSKSLESCIASFTICSIFGCISWMTFSAMVGMIDAMKSGLLRVAQTTSES
jgi:hypothetical protein